MKKIILSILILLLTGCGEHCIMGCWDDIDFNNNSEDTRFVDIYLEDEIDNNGFYHIQSEGSYHHVYFCSEPLSRVKWGTNSFFIVEDHLGNMYEEPIIQYSTYANDEGNGQQIFALYDVEPGDTLMIYGYINQTIYDYLYFIIDGE